MTDSLIDDARSAQLAANLARVRARIDAAARAAGRAPEEVRLLPVTKFHPADDVARLVALGYPEVGENREQEGREKAAVPGARIHMIGQIQAKKANSVARWAWSVSSLDSVRLAEGLDRGMALALDRGDRLITEGPNAEVLPCLIQLSFDGDPHRGGVAEADLAELVERVVAAPRLRLAGFMCVPPLGSDEDKVFAWAREHTQATSEQLGGPLEFSAGMSGDLEKAVAHGSTIVRVGTDILGPRP